MEPLDYISSYVEALVSLLVFGVSIPTILMNVPLRLQNIREQYGTDIEIGSIGIKISRIASVGVVVTVVILSIGLILLYQIPSPPFFCNASLAIPQGPGCQLRQLFVSTASVWVNVLLFANIILAAIFILVLRSYRRDSIIQRLGKECRDQAVSQNGVLHEDVLLNLGELGEMCAAGREKQGLLLTLEGLLNLDLAPKSWMNIAEAVIQTTTGGDERNIALALKLLQSIFRRSSQSNLGEEAMKQFHNRDILTKLESMYIQALGIDSPLVHSQLMTGYDEIATQEPNDAAKAFLHIGHHALHRDLYQYAVYALDKLDTLIMEILDEGEGKCPPHAMDAMYNYFALLAYFWNHGINTRKHALIYLDQLSEAYGWDDAQLNDLLSHAEQTMRSSNLKTADMLEQMLYSNRQMSLVREALTKVEGLNERHEERVLMRFPSLAELREADVAALMSCGLPKNQAEAILWQT